MNLISLILSIIGICLTIGIAWYQSIMSQNQTKILTEIRKIVEEQENINQKIKHIDNTLVNISNKNFNQGSGIIGNSGGDIIGNTWKG